MEYELSHKKKNETTALIAFLKLSQLLNSFEDLYCLFVLIMSLVRFKFENFSYRCSFHINTPISVYYTRIGAMCISGIPL